MAEKLVRKNWSREETILALDLYYQVPFSKIYSSNPKIISLAEKLGRTPGSVGMKMCNLAAFDETLLSKGRSGLKNGSKLDKIIWNEFKEDYQKLLDEKEKAMQILGLMEDIQIDDNDSAEILIPNIDADLTVETMVKIRKGQSFFRKAVLSSYAERCCLTGITIPEFLTACHIKPWSVSDDANEKLNPQNGICMNELYHKAFDVGYISISTDYKLMVSDRLKAHKRLDETTRLWFVKEEGKEIYLPERNLPDKHFLEYHNDVIFNKVQDCG